MAHTPLPEALLRALPKTDLHVHLDGSLRLKTLIELARTRGVTLPSTTEEGLKALVFKERYASLGEYLHGFAYTCAVLQDPEALERAAYELAADNIAEGVRYIEVRFAPHLHMGNGMGYRDVLSAVHRGLHRAEREHRQSASVRERGEPPFRAGLIVCAMRMFTKGFSAWFRQLCEALGEAPPELVYRTASLELARAAVRVRDEAGIPIVGFDLAGQEAGYPAANHVEAYAHAHRHFLKRTVHAGEAYGPESIFQAITDLHADRIGHGYHLFSPELVQDRSVRDPQRYVHDLIEYIGHKRITIEVCITSNLQTNPALTDVRQHHFRKMVEHRLSATLCTDNRLVSDTTVTKELTLALDAFQMSPRQLRNSIIHGFKRSFYPGSYPEKRTYVRQVIDFYDAVYFEHMGEGVPGVEREPD